MALLTATNGNLQVAAGALSDIPAGAFTIAVLFRRDGTTTDGFEALLALVSGGGVITNLGMDADAAPYEVSFSQGGFSRTFGFNDLSNSAAYLFVVIKTDGEVTPRGNLYKFDIGSPAWNGWTNASGTVENRADTIDVGWLLNQPGGFPTNGGIWVAAVWDGALSESAITDSVTGLHIGVQQWLDFNPVALWRPGETDPVEDESTAGTSNETSSTGVTITAGNPTGFNMSFGAAGPPNIGYQSTSLHPGRGPSRFARFITRTMSTKLDEVVDATATPSTVSGTTTISTPAITAGSTISATTVSATTSVGSSAAQAGAVVTPTTVAGSTTIPTPSIQAGGSATATPDTVAAVASVPTTTVSTGSNISAATVSGTASLPAPTVQAGSVVSATTVSAVTSIPATTTRAGAVVTPTVVAGSTTIPAPTLSAGSIVVATTVAGTASIPATTTQTGSIVTPVTVSAVASIPTPAVSAGGSATAVAVTVAGATTLPAPSIQAGSTVLAATVASSASIPRPVIPAGPATVTAAVVIASPVIVTGSTISAVSVSATTSIPSPSIIIRTQPTVVQCTVTIAAPTIVTGSIVSPSVVAATTSIPFPSIVAIIPAPLPDDYEIDLTPVSIPISHSGQTVDVNVGVSA